MPKPCKSLDRMLELSKQRIAPFSGYLHISKAILAHHQIPLQSLFSIRAHGNGMNNALVKGRAIENGDYLIVKATPTPTWANGIYLLLLGTTLMVRHVYVRPQSILLLSEGLGTTPPLEIHPRDREIILGEVVYVVKNHP